MFVKLISQTMQHVVVGLEAMHAAVSTLIHVLSGLAVEPTFRPTVRRARTDINRCNANSISV